MGLTLAVALVAAGLRASQALAAVLLYRLASFWLVAFAGWLIFLWLRHRRPARAIPPPQSCHPPTRRGGQSNTEAAGCQAATRLQTAKRLARG